MTVSSQQLYDLLPAIHRLRDAEKNGELKTYLSVFAEQITVLQENIDQLYDDQFIETCAEWVVPYIGDLIGYKPLHNKASTALSQRAEVANTIAYRRRKGTASMLEQLARDVSAWPARVVEFFQLLATTQYMNHIRSTNHAVPDLLDWQKLHHLNTAFDTTAHTVDVRHIDTDQGKYNIKNIGIYLWRLHSYSLTQSPVLAVAPGRYFFSPLQHDIPLFNKPVSEAEISQLAEPLNVPHLINRRVMDSDPSAYYGQDKSIMIYQDSGGNGGLEDIPEHMIHVCSLADANGQWINEPTDEPVDPIGDPNVFKKVVVIDPETGRLAIPPHMVADSATLWANFHYGFSANVGGGTYERGSAFDAQLTPVETVSDPQSIQTTLNGLNGQGVVEIIDSTRYPETLAIEVNADQRIELRAANEHRPVVVLNGDLVMSGLMPAAEQTGGVVTLDGLLIAGGSIVIPAVANGLRLLRLRHCTLVPGLNLNQQGEPTSPGAPSLVIESDAVKIIIEDCIVGGIRVIEGAEVEIKNSIIDANATDEVAYAALDSFQAGAPLKIENSTVTGKVHTRIMNLASNSLFDASLAKIDSWPSPLVAERKQQGCVRFSYVPLNARLPRRFRCQPEFAINQAIQRAQQKNNLNATQKKQISELIINRVKPVFKDTRYGQPAYRQLALSCAKELTRGADDESEMGVFHDLYQPQREANLKLRLKEYLRFGLEAGIFYET